MKFTSPGMKPGPLAYVSPSMLRCGHTVQVKTKVSLDSLPIILSKGNGIAS